MPQLAHIYILTVQALMYMKPLFLKAFAKGLLRQPVPRNDKS